MMQARLRRLPAGSAALTACLIVARHPTDQPHVTREFKVLTGVPPTRFLAHPMSITAMLTDALDASTAPVSNLFKTSAPASGRLPGMRQ
jgi:hypothetical protein